MAPPPALTPDQITDYHLSNVALRGRKRYPADAEERAAATTCHQCRQKTMDIKTMCRSGACVGVRGDGKLIMYEM